MLRLKRFMHAPTSWLTQHPVRACHGHLVPLTPMETPMTANPTPAELIARSNRLGADPRNTNYAGGNTSAKGTETDPVTNEPVELLWVKGSGGDLGTLTRGWAGGPSPRSASCPCRRLPGGGP